MLRIAGFVDAHAHLWLDDAPLGVPFDDLRSSGVIAAVDAGTSGVEGYTAARAMWNACMPVRAFVNVARGGLRGARDAWQPPSRTPSQDLAGMSVDGVKVRLGESSDANDAGDLRRALDAAETLGVRLMVHPTNAATAPSILLDALRDGDILTHCFCGGRWSLVDESGSLRAAAKRARERGVRFDLGAARRHYDPSVARAALRAGFAPDFVSTDRVAISRSGTPARTMLEALHEIVAAGMRADDALAAATTKPADFFRFTLPEITSERYVEIDEDFTRIRVAG